MIGEGNDVYLDDESVEEHHAQIVYNGRDFQLEELERSAEIYITHMKPGEIEPTMLEIEEVAGAFRPRLLQNNLVLEF